MKNLKNLFSAAIWLIGVALLFAPGPGSVSEAATIVVNKLQVAASDGNPVGFFDADSTDGLCADASGGCNLLAALDHSRYTPGPDTIIFSVSGTILNSKFTITQDGTIIDGSMSDIVLEAKSLASILIIQSSSNVIKGLTFTGHPSASSFYGIEIIDGANNIIGGLTPAERNVITGNSNGIWIHGTGAVDNVVIGNYIGVDSSGSVADGNNIGVNIALGAERNRIGGTTSQERNIISGNLSKGINIGTNGNNNVIIGNYIGVDVTGLIAVPNGRGVTLFGSSGNRVGGAIAGERNIISGNTSWGLQISGEDSAVAFGNYIGTDASGTIAVPNKTGIYIINSNVITIGGALAGEGNVISGNSLFGIYLSADSCKFIGNYIGTDATGSQPLGNDSVGIHFEWGADFNAIGGSSIAEGNVIAYNGFGLQITSPANFFGTPTHYNTIRYNSFFDNLGPGIKFTGLTTQDDILPPAITTATTSGITGTAAASATIDIYIADGIISDSAEGLTHVGTGTSDGTGAFTISLSGVNNDDHLTATVTDSLGNTSEFAASTIALLSFPPVLDSIGPKSVDENQNLSFGVTASDADGTAPQLTSSGLPTGALFTDNGEGTGSFDWTPDYTQAGSYSVTFYASDGTAIDSEIIIIGVTNVNRPPVINPIGDRTISEGDTLTFSVSSSDPDGGNPFMTMSSPDLPTEATFQGTFNAIGVYRFNWPTDFSDSGIYTAIFTANDGNGGIDEDTISITVNNVACADLVITSLTLDGPQQITPGKELGFRLNATVQNIGDAPSSIVTAGFYLSTDSIIDPTDTVLVNGLVTIPAIAAGGTYTLNIDSLISVVGSIPATATPVLWYLGLYTDNSFSMLECNEENNTTRIPVDIANNIYPIFPLIGDKTANEGELLTFGISAFDWDLDSLIFTASSDVLPLTLLTDNGDGTATFHWTPPVGSAGSYLIDFAVFDRSTGFVPQIITITVSNVNNPPVIDPLPDTVKVNEGDSVLFYVYAEDFEDCRFSLQMTSPDLPVAATFSSFSGECSQEGEFNWLTNFTDAGTYHAIITATDDSGGIATDSVVIVVNDVNRPPVQIIGGENSIFEGDRLLLSIQASDPDNDNLVISISSDLPAAALFVDDGNGNASLFWQTSFFDAGSYTAIFTTSDGNGGIDADTISILVSNVNQLPILDPINDTSIIEGQSLVISLSGSDPDSESVFFIVSGAPLGSDFVDNGDGTAIFSWTPAFDQSGEYFIEFFLEDNNKEGVSDSVIIIVENFNRPPSFDQIPDTIVVDENSFTSFDVLAADPDGEDCLSLSLSSPDLPEQAIFVYDGDCLYFGRFEWETTYDDAGIYQAIFAVDDGLLGLAEDTVIIIVNNKNQAPRFEFIKFEETDEGVNINFLIIATDGDSTIPTIESISPLPPGAQYGDNRNGSGVFDWTPDFNQNGEYLITFVATDDSSATDTMDVFIFVNEAGDAELTVKNATCVQCSPAQNFTDIIVTERRFSIEFNSQINTLSLNGNLSFASTSGQTFDYFFEEYTKLLYVYPFSKSEPFRPADTITVFLSTGITDLSESPLDSNYSLTYFTGPIVYPGDADNNGVVDERDILSLGLYWNLTGPAREIAGEVSPLEFFPSPGHFQVLSEKWEPNLAAYADADGSGVVNADDICGVSFNFGLSNQSSQKNSGDMLAFKQLDNSVMQQMYNALIECPNSAGKIHLIEFLENAINSQSVILPTEVELYQNYPNPFNPSTTIEFYLPEQQYVTLDIYNILGQRVVSLVDRDMDAGFQSVNWSGRDNSGSEIASGIYFYLLKTDDRKISKRMMMLK